MVEGLSGIENKLKKSTKGNLEEILKYLEKTKVFFPRVRILLKN